MNKLTFVMIAALTLAGCSSSPPIVTDNAPTPATPEAQPDKVVSRINDLDARPKWLNEEHPFEIRDGNVIFLGQTTIPGDHRVEAGYAIADNNAKGAICSSIESRLDFIFQNAEQGTAIDSNQVRRIGAEACKITTSSIRPGNRYWEKVAMTSGSGERVTRFKVFATVTMPEVDFKRAVINSIRKQEGKGGISEEFATKVDAQWDQLTKGGTH